MAFRTSDEMLHEPRAVFRYKDLIALEMSEVTKKSVYSYNTQSSYYSVVADKLEGLSKEV